MICNRIRFVLILFLSGLLPLCDIARPVAFTNASSWNVCLQPDSRAFPVAQDLANILDRNRIEIVAIRSSKRNGLFPGWKDACWIETRTGILEVIFFPGENKRAQIIRKKSDPDFWVTLVIAPNGEEAEIQGWKTYDLIGKNFWISTTSEILGKQLETISESSIL